MTAFTELVGELGVRGFNVTIPYKGAIIELLDKVDPEAERIGAVNTVLNTGGELVGFNTDFYGVQMTFEKAAFDPKGRKVLVVGAGGAARSVLTHLSHCQAEIFPLQPDQGQGRRAGQDLRWDHGRLQGGNAPEGVRCGRELHPLGDEGLS